MLGLITLTDERCSDLKIDGYEAAYGMLPHFFFETHYSYDLVHFMTTFLWSLLRLP